MTKILVLYYSSNGSTLALARSIAVGIEQGGGEALLRTVPAIGREENEQKPQSPYVTKDDLAQCDGLALGSATRFGQMSSHLRYFFDSTADIWIKGELTDKPACVFTSTSSLHGGQESTLLSMSLPLIHHGMLLLGVPYTEPELHTTQSGGTPYGASHVAENGQNRLTAEEKHLAQVLGKRLTATATKLKNN